MASLKRLTNEINKKGPFQDKLSIPYEISWINSHTDFYDSMNILAKISIDIYNNSILIMDIPSSYPFKPPNIWINILHGSKRYDRYCADITEIINKRTFLSCSDILLAWLFSLNFCNINKTYTINNIPNSIPISCLCCNSITCYNKWNPGFQIQDIIYEFIFTKKLLFFTSKLGLKYINSIFNNDKWNLSDDIILHIFKFNY